MIVDVHQHLPQQDLDEHLARTKAICDRLGIDRVCMFGRDNDLTLEAAKKDPDWIVAFVYIQPGEGDPDLVSRYHDRGFKGVKLIRPTANYDDEQFHPIYKQAEERGMPVLFHTGVVARGGSWEKIPEPQNVSSARMHPLFLDGIARLFPRLPIVMAHLGVASFDDGGMVTKWNYNVYADLCGAMMSRARLKGEMWAFERFSEALWWEGAIEKLVFASDWPGEDMEWAFKCYQRFLDYVQAPKDVREAVMGGTMAKLLQLE